MPGTGKRTSQPHGTVSFFSLATAAALFTILIWGASPMVTKLGTATVDGFTLSILRTVIAIPMALLLIWLMRLKLPWQGLDKFYLLGVAVTGLIGFPVLFTIGVSYTTAGHAAVAQAATPIFAGLLAALDNRRWPAVRWWLGVSVAFVGAVILIVEATGMSTAGATWQGDLLVLGGAFSAAVSFIFGGRLTPRFGAPAVTMWSVVVAGLLVSPFLVTRVDLMMISNFTPLVWFALLYLSLGASILAYISWFYALGRGGIAQMSVWHFALPVVGIGSAALVLGEPLTPMLLAATVVILFGVGLVQRR